MDLFPSSLSQGLETTDMDIAQEQPPVSHTRWPKSDAIVLPGSLPRASAKSPGLLVSYELDSMKADSCEALPGAWLVESP